MKMTRFCLLTLLTLASNKCSASYDDIEILISQKTDRRHNKDTLRVVSLNAEYLMYDISEGCQKSWRGCPWKNASEALRHLQNVSDTLAVYDADIIFLNEVHSLFELEKLIERLPEGYSPYLIAGTDHITGQNVGLLTKIDPMKEIYRSDEREKFPVINSTCNYFGDGGDEGVSKNLIMEVDVGNGVKIVFIAAHLLSRPKEVDRCAMREAQAKVIRRAVDDISKTTEPREIVLLGDFNDFDDAVLDVQGNVPLSSALRIMKGTHGQADEPSGVVLHNLAECVEIERRYSSFYDKEKKCVLNGVNELYLIDHILVSERLREAVHSVRIDHSYGPTESRHECVDDEDYVSDHWPLIVDFDLRKLGLVKVE